MAFEDALRNMTDVLAMTFNPEVAMQQKQMEYKKRQDAIGQLQEGIQSGAIDPVVGNQRLQQLGGQAVGPNQLTLDRQEALRQKQQQDALNAQIRPQLQQIAADPNLTPQQKQQKAFDLYAQLNPQAALKTAAIPSSQLTPTAGGDIYQVEKGVFGPTATATGLKGKQAAAGQGGYYGTQTTLSDEDAKYIAGAFKKDKTAILGLRPADKSKVWRFLVAGAKEEGTTPEQLAGMRAEFGGLAAQERTMGTRAGQISIAANEANKMAPIVITNMEAVGPSGFVPYNKAANIAKSQTGDPKIKAYVASINAFVNSYSRAINPTGAATINDKEHARELLDAADSPEQVRAVISTLQQEMRAAMAAPEEARKNLMEEMTKPKKKEVSTGGWSARIVR